MYKKFDYKTMIETGFDILTKRGERVPFILNDIQNDFLNRLDQDFPEQQGIRYNIDKARQEGFSALIDAIFTCDFLARENIGSQIISHKDKETEVLIKRVSFYIDSFCEKNGINRKDILATDSANHLENKNNGSYLFIGTAGARTLGRGGTLQNIHWSEVAFYPSGPNSSPEQLVSGAEQQVLMGVGKIFRESTGNMVGDFFHKEIERSRKGESGFKFVFYPWYMHGAEYTTTIQVDFTPEEQKLVDNVLKIAQNVTRQQLNWYILKSREYSSVALFLREYPTTVEESFLTTGGAFFDADSMMFYREQIKQPIRMGNLAADGDWI